jgi:predicted nucleotidyltransferase
MSCPAKAGGLLAGPLRNSYNTPMVSEEVLNEVRRRLVEGFHPDKIILFGSQARGTADDRSDVDILVIGRFEGERRKVALEMDRALGGLKYAFDVLLATPEEFDVDRLIPGTVSRYADKEGRVLYGRAA